ncbi:GON domain, partial [Paramuricea clavata]
VFKMDLTGTGMMFVTPIDWRYGGYHGCSGNTPNQYSVSSTKQVVSGRCGGFCGSCWARTLSVKPEGC